jgi:hypothetical protein
VKDKLLVIIPAYNEERSVTCVIRDIRNHLPHAHILVINDGSHDATSRVARQAGVRVLDLFDNLGIGVAMQTGYKYAFERGYALAVQCDGDGQHPADQIPALVQPIIDGECDLVVGSRFLKRIDYKASFLRRSGMKLFAAIISSIVGREVTDTTSGFRAVNRSLIRYFSLYYPYDYPEVESLVFVHKAGFRFREIPIIMKHRRNGVSSITRGKSAYYVVKVLLAIFLDLLRKLPKQQGGGIDA